MIDASILLYSNYGGVLMRSKRIPAEEQYRLIMECRQSGLTDHQWCVERKRKIASTCSKSSNGKSSNGPFHY